MEGRHVGLDFYDLLIEAQSGFYVNHDRSLTAPIRRMLVAAAFYINQRNGVRDLLIKSFFEERHREFAAVLAMS